MRYVPLLILLAAPATAQPAPEAKGIECYCTDRDGTRVEMGQFTCLDVGGRRFTAQCQMSLNSPMWREVAEGCLSSEVPAPLNYSG